MASTRRGNACPARRTRSIGAMRSMVIRALAILQLVRMPLALAVGSDLWLATLLV